MTDDASTQQLTKSNPASKSSEGLAATSNASGSGKDGRATFQWMEAPGRPLGGARGFPGGL
jgi:hypothetical protein